LPQYDMATVDVVYVGHHIASISAVVHGLQLMWLTSAVIHVGRRKWITVDVVDVGRHSCQPSHMDYG